VERQDALLVFTVFIGPSDDEALRLKRGLGSGLVDAGGRHFFWCKCSKTETPKIRQAQSSSE
jgi:hypothetical protein